MPEAPAVRIPSVDESPPTKLLPFVLALVAGSVDIIGFLGLNLFTAHITGNFAILAAHIAAGREASLPLMISVPVFVVVLALTRLLAAALERTQIAPLGMLLLLQFILLCAFFAICLPTGPGVNPNAPIMLVAGMLGVSAMAVQTALVRIGLAGAPSTAVQTTNITLLTMDLGEMLLGRDAGRIVNARDRALHTWPAIAGFLLGCVLGAGCARRRSACGPSCCRRLSRSSRSPWAYARRYPLLPLGRADGGRRAAAHRRSAQQRTRLSSGNRRRRGAVAVRAREARRYRQLPAAAALFGG